jgi:hypothetical protein
MKVNKKRIKEISIKVAKYLTISLVIVSSFFLGRLNKELSQVDVEIESFKSVSRSEVNIAIDERNNLIVIDIESGNYTIYEDSIGQSIFKLYAKNIWTQNVND